MNHVMKTELTDSADPDQQPATEARVAELEVELRQMKVRSELQKIQIHFLRKELQDLKMQASIS